MVDRQLKRPAIKETVSMRQEGVLTLYQDSR